MPFAGGRSGLVGAWCPLHEPQIAVGIAEGEERPVAAALGVGARVGALLWGTAGRATCRSRRCHGRRVRRGPLDVGDDEPALGRAWRGGCESLAEGDRGPQPGGVNRTMR